MISEGINSKLYRIVPIDALYTILKYNKFELTTDFEDELERKAGVRRDYDVTSNDTFKKYRKKVYFMSTARSITSRYIMDFLLGTSSAIMVLDGRKLMSAGYTGHAVNFDDLRSTNTKTLVFDESEDRLYSNKDQIPNATKFISEIHVYVNMDSYKSNKNQVQGKINLVQKMSLKYGIDTYYYNEESAFKKLDKKHSIHSSIDLTSSGDKRVDTKSRRKEDSLVSTYIEFFTTQNENELSKDAYSILTDITSKKNVW